MKKILVALVMTVALLNSGLSYAQTFNMDVFFNNLFSNTFPFTSSNPFHVSSVEEIIKDIQTGNAQGNNVWTYSHTSFQSYVRVIADDYTYESFTKYVNTIITYNGNVYTPPVPEPRTWVTLLLGLILIAYVAYIRITR